MNYVEPKCQRMIKEKVVRIAIADHSGEKSGKYKKYEKWTKGELYEQSE